MEMERRLQSRTQTIVVSALAETIKLSIAGLLGCALLIQEDAHAERNSPPNLCALENAEFNNERNLTALIATEESSSQNAIRVSELKHQLVTLRNEHLQARFKLFDAKVTQVKRTMSDNSHTWTASFLQGQKKFDSLSIQVLKVSAPFLDVFNLLAAVVCPQSQPLIMLSINISDSDLQRNFAKIGDFTPEYPTSSLAQLRPSLSKLKVGDFATVSGYAQIYTDKIPFSPNEYYLLRTEKLPPRSPEVHELQNGLISPALPGLSPLQFFQRGDSAMIIYNAKITEINKQ